MFPTLPPIISDFLIPFTVLRRYRQFSDFFVTSDNFFFFPTLPHLGPQGFGPKGEILSWTFSPSPFSPASTPTFPPLPHQLRLSHPFRINSDFPTFFRINSDFPTSSPKSTIVSVILLIPPSISYHVSGLLTIAPTSRSPREFSCLVTIVTVPISPWMLLSCYDSYSSVDVRTFRYINPHDL